jgi:hypothetical protein
MGNQARRRRRMIQEQQVRVIEDISSKGVAAAAEELINSDRDENEDDWHWEMMGPVHYAESKGLWYCTMIAWREVVGEN